MTTSPPNGDALAGQIRHHQATDTDLSDVARSLTDMHAHRPGLWQQDLNRANAELHRNGILPGLDIVGVRGQDLVARDAQGHVQVVDATNLNRHHEDQTGATQTADGRTAHLAADGSGTVTAKRGDNAPWQLSQSLLHAQGNEHPTPNEIANYQRELERLNGKSVSHIKPGEESRCHQASTVEIELNLLENAQTMQPAVNDKRSKHQPLKRMPL